MVLDRFRLAQSAAALVACSLGACALLVGSPDGHRLFVADEGGTVAGDAPDDPPPDAVDDSPAAEPDGGDAGDASTDAAMQADADAGPFAGPAIVLATGESTPEGVALNSAALFWANGGNSTIRRLNRSLDGGFRPIATDAGPDASSFASTAAASAPPPTDLLADTTYLYALVGVGATNQICASFLPYALAGTGGSLGCAYPTTMCSGTARRLATDGSNVYLSASACGTPQSPSIFVEGAPGTNNTGWTKFGPLSSPALAMAGDTVRVYFAVANQIFSQLLSTTTFAPTQFAESPPQATITDLAVDGKNVYWTDTLGNVVASAKSGAGFSVVLASAQDQPFRLAQDSSNLYWTNAGTQSMDGSIAMVAKSGGLPVVLASGQRHPWGIAVDESSVYWTDSVANTVMMLPR
jgi:hypothetical protein